MLSLRRPYRNPEALRPLARQLRECRTAVGLRGRRDSVVADKTILKLRVSAVLFFLLKKTPLYAYGYVTPSPGGPFPPSFVFPGDSGLDVDRR